MKRPSREEYESAVALARAAIRAHKKRPRIRADRSPQALLAKVREKQANGEALTEADFGAMQAALAEQESRKQRGRGRPKGTRDFAALGAFRAAAYAMGETALRHSYRNDATGHRFTQCDAIAEAMHAEGFRTLATYDGAAREMRALRRHQRKLRESVGSISRQMQETARAVHEAFQPLVQEIDSAFSGLSEAMKPIQSQMQETARAVNQAFRPLIQQMREPVRASSGLERIIHAQTTLSPETRRAIERYMKTMR